MVKEQLHDEKKEHSEVVEHKPLINVLIIKKIVILLLLRIDGAVNLIGNIHWVIISGIVLSLSDCLLHQ